MAVLDELLRARLGAQFTSRVNDVLSSVGLTVLQLLPQDYNRLGFVVINLSVNSLYVGPFADVSSTKGIRVGASGGNLAVLWEEDLILPGLEWFAVAAGAGSALLTVELVAY